MDHLFSYLLWDLRADQMQSDALTLALNHKKYRARQRKKDAQI